MNSVLSKEIFLEIEEGCKKLMNDFIMYCREKDPSQSDLDITNLAQLCFLFASSIMVEDL